MPKTPPTSFAPAERASKSDLFRQSRLIEDTPLLRQLYDAVSDVVLILNRHRQIVFCNKRMADLTGVADRRELYGLRPGEALGCHNACSSAGGCGTTPFCSACGAVNAILTSQAGDADTRECSITRSDGLDPLELLVRASPLDLNGTSFTVLSASDISHEKRRRVLEHAFFHDLMNTAMGLKLFTRTLSNAPFARVQSLTDGIRNGIERLLAEIEEQRDLVRAENNELAARVGPVRSLTFVEGLVGLYSQYSALQHCPLHVAAGAEDFTFHSDHTLLARVLGNMIKNALEASEEGRPVTVGCRQADGRVEFRVHNHGAMPPDVQLQVFQRSFTTKGAGRGLGTYSMKLLSERYLGGAVTFTSAEAEGTTFVATYPLELAAQ